MFYEDVFNDLYSEEGNLYMKINEAIMLNVPLEFTHKELKLLLSQFNKAYDFEVRNNDLINRIRKLKINNT